MKAIACLIIHRDQYSFIPARDGRNYVHSACFPLKQHAAIIACHLRMGRLYILHRRRFLTASSRRFISLSTGITETSPTPRLTSFIRMILVLSDTQPLQLQREKGM